MSPDAPLALFAETQVPGGELAALRLLILSIVVAVIALVASRCLRAACGRLGPPRDRQQIARRFGDFALDAALTVPEGSVTALFGQSGAGKSSLLGAVAGLVRPDSGFIRIGGRTLFNADTQVSLPPERRRLGVVFGTGAYSLT